MDVKSTHPPWLHTYFDIMTFRLEKGGVGSVKKARDSDLIPDNSGKTSPGIQPESSQV